MPLSGSAGSVTGAVIADIDANTMKKTEMEYGISHEGLDFQSKVIFATPFAEYMQNFPYEKNGLWTVVRKILPEEYSFDVTAAKEKYAQVQRLFCTDAEDEAGKNPFYNPTSTADIKSIFNMLSGYSNRP